MTVGQEKVSRCQGPFSLGDRPLLGHRVLPRIHQGRSGGCGVDSSEKT
jgi:hypothetical protein